MSVCRYFLQGNCRFGDRCRFKHSYSNQPYEFNEYDEEDDYGRNDYEYQQNRGRQQSNNSYYNQGPDRQYDNRYSENQYYTSGRSYSNDRKAYNESFKEPAEPDYYANKYNKNKLQWMSEDYKKQVNQQSPRSDGRFFNTSTPKSKTSFSFKNTEVQSRRDQPNDLHMNEKNLIDAEIIKDDVLLWEIGNQWPFTCYCPTPGKSAFPGFLDLSPEELRLEAYNAKENNSYHTYVEAVEKTLHDIKMKRENLKQPSVELMTIIEKIRKGEIFISDSVDGIIPSRPKNNQIALEDMVADEFSTPQTNTASSFSFKTAQASFFGNQTSPASVFGNQAAPASVFGNQAAPASSFSFKTTLETESKGSASSFSFKLPDESSSNLRGVEAGNDIYTHLDKISEQDKAQFTAPTFTLGKIPTMPPPQQMCF